MGQDEEVVSGDETGMSQEAWDSRRCRIAADRSASLTELRSVRSSAADDWVARVGQSC